MSLEGEGVKNLDLVEEAELAAKNSVSNWIRVALHETFLQGLKQAWLVYAGESNTQSSDTLDDTVIEVSHGAFVECLALVEKVANVWKDKLIEANHARVAEWVQEVFESGKSTLWRTVEEETPSGQKSESVTNPQEESPDGEIQDSQEQESKDAFRDEEKRESSDNTKMIPFCKLRRMTRKTFVGEKVMEDPFDIFKEMGRNGESYWPLDWKIIEDACDNLPIRLQQPISSEGVNQDNQQRVKRASERPEGVESKDKRRKIDTISRPASSVASFRGNMNDISELERDSLDRLLHDESLESEAKQPLVLFGALQKVGQVHYSKRFRSDWSQKKNQLERSRAISERLIPNKVSKSSEAGRYKSKILKTVDKADESRRSIDLDLGWSMMEMKMPGDIDNQKRLCAFASVEITLQDEDVDNYKDQLP